MWKARWGSWPLLCDDLKDLKDDLKDVQRREKNLTPFSNTFWDAQEEGAWSSRALGTIFSLSPRWS